MGTNPSRFVEGGWRTSRTKIVDNALVGFCRARRYLPPRRLSRTFCGREPTGGSRTSIFGPASHPGRASTYRSIKSAFAVCCDGGYVDTPATVGMAIASCRASGLTNRLIEIKSSSTVQCRLTKRTLAPGLLAPPFMPGAGRSLALMRAVAASGNGACRNPAPSQRHGRPLRYDP